jgi:hypothetical protein
MTDTPAVRAHRQAPSGLSLVDICEIARDAYIYGYPLVDGYRQLYGWFVDHDHHDYMGAWNRIHIVQTEPDTAGAVLGLDLCREPVVLSVPRIEADRYYLIQGNDLYSHIFDHIGTQTTGNGPGHFLITGPNWQGRAPRAITGKLSCETELALLTFRLQCQDSQDRAKAEARLAGFELTPLSRFMGLPPTAPPPTARFIAPLSLRAERNSLTFFNELNFVLSFCAPHDSERDLMTRLARLNIGRNLAFDPGALSPEARLAIDDGMADAWHQMETSRRRRRTDEPLVVHGSRGQIKGNHINRMIGAVDNLWAIASEERLAYTYQADIAHQRLDGTYHHYALHMPGTSLPPVRGFWSLTLCHMPSGMPVDNPLGRHLFSSADIDRLKREADGGITFYIQREAVKGDWESNWLPAPPGPFTLRLTLYWPKADALSGIWQLPPLIKTH